MGILSSMTTAISGLEANGQALSVISDNIVNANTTGFKSSRSEFQTILAADMGGGGASDIGRGATLAGTTGMFTQGAVNRTERGLDCAIQGNGFFVMRGDQKGLTFSRDGSFRFDKEGWLTNLGGERLQAYTATSDGKVTGKLSDIRLPFASIPAKATNKIEVNLNLDSRIPVGLPLDLTKPDETAHFSTAIQAFDSIGNAHSLNMFFNRTSEGTWEWHAMADGAEMAGGKKGKPEIVASGALNFDAEGKLISSNYDLQNTSFVNAIPNQKLDFTFGDPIDKKGTGEKGTTQYGSKSAMFRNVQDGWSAGYLADTSIDNEGVISGIYTNGQNKTLGQIALARFEANEKLGKAGENQFKETSGSGMANIGKPNSNGRGMLQTKSLEGSNVDIAKEFVEMIKVQRGFQASAKSITTANELLEEVINIKRT